MSTYNISKKYSAATQNQGKENTSMCGQSQMDQRVQMIESNLSRVCLQQDALMPLLQMVELLPQFSKSENTLKQMQKKIEENESKILKSEKNIEKKFKDITNQG